MILITGRSNPQLANALSEALNHPLTPTTSTHFSHPESRFHLDASVRGHSVFILQSGYQPTTPSAPQNTPSDFLIELAMMVQACRMASAPKIICIIPCFPYSQESAQSNASLESSEYHSWPARPGKLVANILTEAGASQIITLDLHHPQFAGYFDCPLDNLPAWPLALQVLNQHRSDCKDGWIVLSPDVGGSRRAVEVANRAQLPVAVLTEAGLIGSITEGASVFLVDDMLDTGSKLCSALEFLCGQRVPFVLVFITHALLSQGCLERLHNQITRNEASNQRIKIVSTDSISSPSTDDSLISRISIAPLLAETIERMQRGESITMAFSQGIR